MSNSPMNVEAVKAKECVAYLRKAADEIARAGHNGWGNTCTLAADEIERLTERLATLERAAGKIVETEAEYWAKRFATMDRAAAPPGGVLGQSQDRRDRRNRRVGIGVRTLGR